MMAEFDTKRYSRCRLRLALVAGFLVTLASVLLQTGPVLAEEIPPEAVPMSDAALFADEAMEDPDALREYVADPLESVNRVVFTFNDKLYFWLLKPVATGYRVVVPKPARESVGNFFFNLKSPMRLVNSLLQAKFTRGGEELARFAVNTTVGGLGLWDPARNWLNLEPSDEDFGQTLAKYGIGDGIYLCLPFLGPTNLRDGVGLIGDHFLYPVSYLYLSNENEVALGIRGEEVVNQTSLKLGDYEAFKAATFDPYSAMRDSYIQHRNSKINDEMEQ